LAALLLFMLGRGSEGFVAGVMICSVGAEEVAGADGEGGTVPRMLAEWGQIERVAYLDQYQSQR